jgi:hypothetical protein
VGYLRSNLWLDAGGSILARVRRARVKYSLAIVARVARKAGARVPIERLTVADAPVATRHTGAHVEDNLTEGAGGARRTGALDSARTALRALSIVPAWVGVAKVDAVLAVSAIEALGANAVVADQALETRAP